MLIVIFIIQKVSFISICILLVVFILYIMGSLDLQYFSWAFSFKVLCFLFRKVEQIAEEAESLRASLDKYNLRNQKRTREANERAELLGRAVCCYHHALV